MVFPEPKQTESALKRRQPWVEYILTEDASLLYPQYRVKQSYSIQDSGDNIIIVPEIAPDLLESFAHIQKAVWWLSTNPSPYSNVLRSREIRHLCQSAAAINMLTERGYEYVFPLTDYITIDPQPRHKIRQVAYNPKKGLTLTLQIMPYVVDTPFVPLISMTESQMSEALGKSMVYIDLGGHPGKDRIPREAAMSQCCVIVANVGTARGFQDVPISRKYKMDITPFEPEMIGSIIMSVLDQYDKLLTDFEMYRRIISMERETFSREVLAIFAKKAYHGDSFATLPSDSRNVITSTMSHFAQGKECL
jgi:hypothetical protein